MTIKEFADLLQRKAKNLKTFSEPVRIGALTATAEMGKRIFDEGKKTDGSQIGKYDTKPIYVSMSAVPKPKGAPTGKPSGKKKVKKITGFFTVEDPVTGEEKTVREVIGRETIAEAGKSKFKNGKPHKSKYFAEGYKGYRKNIGRQVDKIDLSLSGELRLDFSNGKPSAPQPEKINELEYAIIINKKNNQDKVGGANDRFGTVFSPSGKEREDFIRVVQFEFNKRLNA